MPCKREYALLLDCTFKCLVFNLTFSSFFSLYISRCCCFFSPKFEYLLLLFFFFYFKLAYAFWFNRKPINLNGLLSKVLILTIAALEVFLKVCVILTLFLSTSHHWIVDNIKHKPYVLPTQKSFYV